MVFREGEGEGWGVWEVGWTDYMVSRRDVIMVSMETAKEEREREEGELGEGMVTRAMGVLR